MDEKKVKLSLDDIKVESFVTSLDGAKAKGLVGAGVTDETSETAGCTPTYPSYCTKATCNTVCQWTCAVTCPTCATSPSANCCVDI